MERKVLVYMERLLVGGLSVMIAGVFIVLFVRVVRGPDSGEGVTDPLDGFDTLTPLYVGEGASTAIAGGTLAVHDGCLWLTSSVVDDYLLLWPEDWTAEIVEDVVAVRDGEGAVMGLTGEQLSIGGSEVPSLQQRPDLVATGVPEACQGSPGWVVGDVELVGAIGA